MKLASFEAVVENGRIVLPPHVRLPEHASVHVVVSDMEAGSAASGEVLDSQPANDLPTAVKPRQPDDIRKAGEALMELIGSWEGDETPEELAASLRKARSLGRRFQVPDVSP